MYKPIRYQLMFITSALVILALGLSMSVSYYLISSDYEQHIKDSNALMTESLATNISQFLLNAYNVNAEIAINHMELITGDSEQGRVLLANVVKRYPFFQLLVSHNLKGDQTAKSSGSLGNRADRWWFKQFMADGRPFITKSYYSASTQTAVTTALYGIYNGDNLIGVMNADIDTNTLQEMVEKYNSGPGSYAYLLDGDGVVVAHPDKEQVSELYNYKTQKKTVLQKDAQGKDKIVEIDYTIPMGLKNIVDQASQGATGVGEYTDFNNDEYICAYRSIVLPDNSNPWSLIMVQKKSTAMAFLNRVATKNILIVFLILLVSCALIYWLSTRITKPLSAMIKATEQINKGDLTVLISEESSYEIGILAKNFNKMVHTLRALIKNISQATEQVAASSEELTASTEQSAHLSSQMSNSFNDVVSGATKQLHEVDGTANIVAQMSSKIEQIANNANDVVDFSKKASNTASDGGQTIAKAIGQMANIERVVGNSAQLVSKLGERSKEIVRIVNAISGIAGQTNLLALNAAIEAARAGEQGRGFAVVAEEVRKLAEQSHHEAEQIGNLINEICLDTDKAVIAMNEGSQEVQIGTEVVNSAGCEFDKIITLIEDVSKQVQTIFASIQHISNSTKKIVSSVNEIDKVSNETQSQIQNAFVASQEQSAAMEEIASASHALAKLAEKLKSTVSTFNI